MEWRTGSVTTVACETPQGEVFIVSLWHVVSVSRVGDGYWCVYTVDGVCRDLSIESGHNLLGSLGWSVRREKNGTEFVSPKTPT